MFDPGRAGAFRGPARIEHQCLILAAVAEFIRNLLGQFLNTFWITFGVSLEPFLGADRPKKEGAKPSAQLGHSIIIGNNQPPNNVS